MFDLTPLYRSTVGFDRLASMLESMVSAENGSAGYPPYNIERVGENEYRITMAVAGFGEDDVDVELKESCLKVSARKSNKLESQGSMIYQGIASREFERRFQLADFVRVTGASLENGLLHIDLERELPEEMKPRVIEVKTGRNAPRRTIGRKIA
ncbi:MAG: Hsp20 family protein [Hyphomicrobiales bacterium]